MVIYERLIRPFLLKLDAEKAHDITLSALAWAQQHPGGRAALRLLAGPLPHAPVNLWGLTFPNALGVAAGFDKEARVAAGLALLGFGHVEVGTLTPRPQPGNPRPRVFRLPADQALINRMGFPNEGVNPAVLRLQRLAAANLGCIIGVSLGKQKETPLLNAAADYIQVMTAVYPYADYLAVNISSPNTPGLRELQSRAYLDELLHALQAENESLAAQYGMRKRPLLVKIAPDLTWPELDEIIAAAQYRRVNGMIAVNTTISREGLRDPLQGESGGLSGRPLAARSKEIITYIHRQTAGDLPVIGVGGIQSATDARAVLDAGASLVQLYTGLVYRGPRLAGNILRKLHAFPMPT